MEYPKINTLWKRRRENPNKGKIIEGEYSCPEFPNIKKWLVTEKIDGTNIRIFWDGGNVRFSGRTDNSQIPARLIEHLQKVFTIEEMQSIFKEDSKEIILFGEGYGKKIQGCGSRYISESTSFILFDVYIDGWWLERDKMEQIAQELEIGVVPLIGIMTEEEIIDLIKSEPKSSISEDKTLIMEGIVARPSPLMLYRNGDPIFMKLKVKDYH